MEAEFSHPIPIEQIKERRKTVSLVACEGEREEVAKRLGVLSISRLEGRLSYHRKGDLIVISGEVSADLEQACVVTLDPVKETINSQFEVFYTLAIGTPSEDLDLDAPEPLEGDVLDLGEVVTEQIALNLSPYPRAPGAGVFVDMTAGEEATPFEALKSLQDKS